MSFQRSLNVNLEVGQGPKARQVRNSMLKQRKTTWTASRRVQQPKIAEASIALALAVAAAAVASAAAIAAAAVASAVALALVAVRAAVAVAAIR